MPPPWLGSHKKTLCLQCKGFSVFKCLCMFYVTSFILDYLIRSALLLIFVITALMIRCANLIKGLCFKKRFWESGMNFLLDYGFLLHRISSSVSCSIFLLLVSFTLVKRKSSLMLSGVWSVTIHWSLDNNTVKRLFTCFLNRCQFLFFLTIDSTTSFTV